MLFSGGHSNHPIETFVRLLTECGIEILVDVRSVPYSRWNPQFNRKALAEQLELASVHYEWSGDSLGGKSGAPSTADPRFRDALEALVARSRESHIALMCSERDPMRCHRTTKLAAWIHRFASGATLHHIVPQPNGPAELVESRALEAQLKPSLIWPELRTIAPIR